MTDEMHEEESPRMAALKEVLELLGEMEVAPHRPKAPPMEEPPMEASPQEGDGEAALPEGTDMEALKAKLAALLG